MNSSKGTGVKTATCWDGCQGSCETVLQCDDGSTLLWHAGSAPVSLSAPHRFLSGSQPSVLSLFPSLSPVFHFAELKGVTQVFMAGRLKEIHWQLTLSSITNIITIITNMLFKFSRSDHTKKSAIEHLDAPLL